ncbi:MAG: DUF5681 domain-containing protein [Alphaproteobacteria bacterium]
MSTYDDDNKEKPATDKNKAGRHSNGRWKKGHCPNPKGRARAKIKEELEFVRSIQKHSLGMYEFSREPVEMKIDGKVAYMPRLSAVHHKQFETAMKGSVTAQREFLKEARDSDKTVALLEKRFIELTMTKADRLSNDNNGEPGELPLELELEYLRLQSILHGFFPTKYPKPK